MSKILLELGAEGGSITIVKNNDLTYALRKQEMSYEFESEPEIGAIDKITPLNSMTEIFELFKQHENWLFLYPLIVDDEIKPLLAKIINHTNDESLKDNWSRILYKA